MLRPRKKIRKMEIREDGLVTFYVKVQKWYRRYAKQTHYIVIGLLAVAFISIMMVRSKAKAEQAAAAELAIAEQVFLAGDYDRAISSMTEIMTVYEGTSSSGKAAYYLGDIYFQRQDYENAEKHFRMYINDYGDIKLYKASSMAGIGASLENQGHFAEAAEWFQKAADLSRKGFYSPFYWKDAGRCYRKAEMKEKSRMAYQNIIENYPESQVAQEAEYLLKSL
ncbi:MAG TPA: tetratricopeptide repeat protein [bacterium]|nr:tetratricopeptide repeat protein [bacterium]